MAWTSPKSWVSGDMVTAALLNTHVRDNLLYLHGDAGAITIGNTLTLPASDPTTDNMAARKVYCDTTVAATSFFKYSGTQAFYGTTPTVWTDLNLSSIVGANRAFVYLKIGPGGSAANNVCFRPNGVTAEMSATAGSASSAVHGTAANQYYLICVTDTSGIVEWRAQTAVSNFYVVVTAYIK